MANKLQGILLVRHGSAEDWTSSPYILKDGEPGYDTTNNIYKIGNGTSSWADLPTIGGGVFCSNGFR